MVKTRFLRGLLVLKIPLLMVVMPLAMGILSIQGPIMPFLLKNSFSDILPTLAFLKAAYADHGQEITITLHNSTFGSLSSGGGNQVNIFALSVIHMI